MVAGEPSSAFTASATSLSEGMPAFSNALSIAVDMLSVVGISSPAISAYTPVADISFPSSSVVAGEPNSSLTASDISLSDGIPAFSSAVSIAVDISVVVGISKSPS